MNGNPLFPAAAPDFSDPLGLLRACHERIFQHCALLLRLAAHIADHGSETPQTRETAAKIHRYFSTAARHHHADEEQDLFPHLARQSQTLAELVRQLEQEHGELEALWQELEPLLADPPALTSAADFQTLARRFAEAYRRHAERENEELLLPARALLDNTALQRLGRRMAERRGISLPSSS